MKLKEIENINIKNKEKYIIIFKNILNQIKSNSFDYENQEFQDYIIINEQRLNSRFIHIVPKELLSIFNKIKQDNPNDFLGFTILIGKRQGKEVRLSCFGIPFSLLTQSL